MHYELTGVIPIKVTENIILIEISFDIEVWQSVRSYHDFITRPKAIVFVFVNWFCLSRSLCWVKGVGRMFAYPITKWITCLSIACLIASLVTNSMTELIADLSISKLLTMPA